MIPQHILVSVPSYIRNTWADRIVEVFHEDNPKLYSEIGMWDTVPEDQFDPVVAKIKSAADKVYYELTKGLETC